MPNAMQDLLRHTLRDIGRGLAIAGAVSFFLSALILVVPLFTMQVYDRVMTSHSLDTLTMLAIVSVGGLVLYGVLDFLRGRLLLLLGDRLARRLNVPTLQAAIADSVGGGQRQAGQAIRDLNDLRGFFAGGAIVVPMELLWTPLFIGVLFLLHPLYGIVACGAALLLVVASAVTDAVTRGAFAAGNDATTQAYADVAATVRHAEVIEAMGMLPAVSRRWQASQRRMTGLMDAAGVASKALGAASRTLRLSLQIAIVSVGVVLVVRLEASPGSMIAASILMGRILHPFEQLIDGWRQWVLAMTAMTRVRRLLTGTAQRRDTTPLPRPAGRLVADRLGYLPPGAERAVLRNVSFQLEPGEVLGIVGPSGAGKSTLARMIVGLWPPSQGGLYLDGHSTFAWERESFGRWVGYVPQSVALLDGSIRDNIARMGAADPEDVVAAARAAGVHELVGRLPFGYDTVVGDGNPSLSGGQRQRIALARALFGKPALLVLDEPNANLDQPGEQALLEAVRQAKADGTTVVLIAHKPSIMGVADKLLVLKDGMVEQFGPRAEVMRTIVPTPLPVKRGNVTPLAPALARAGGEA